MTSRTHRASFGNEPLPGGPQLTLAQLIITAENILRIFARPLLIAGIFVVLAWIGFFGVLFPWLHLVILFLFTLFFFDALGMARVHWHPPTRSEVKRRVEEASNLQHRPLDVLEDRPITLEPEQTRLWQLHVANAHEQVKNLRWPKWKSDLSDKDPYALRFALVVLLMVCAIAGWGYLGGRFLASINPALGKTQMMMPTLDAWITPPEYTGLPPIMIATPAGSRFGNELVSIPEGSTITAHIADQDGEAPILSVNGKDLAFAPDDHQGFGITETIHTGSKVSIHRGWEALGSWKTRIVADAPPTINFTEPPAVTERRTVKLAYQASDDYGVASISVRISPRESIPGATSDPIEVPLAEPNAKETKRASFEDLTAHPWAGIGVRMQLVARDARGHETLSTPIDFVLPERIFFQPIARALIEERKKLLQFPTDATVRNEAANIMAGIAHQPANYRGDPVVLMALRSGAVRLVLDRKFEGTAEVNKILWESAVRVEDGAVGLAEQNLRQAQKELADALDRNANEAEIQEKIDQLHQALSQYLSELSTRMAQQPGPVEDLSQILGPQTNVLTPNDLERMLDQMRNMSASGSHEAAREQLQKLQQLLENMQTTRPQLSAEQKQMLRNLGELKKLTQAQQQLIDKTFQSQNGEKGDKTGKELSSEQSDLLKRLEGLMGAMKQENNDGLKHGASAMQSADGKLKQGEMKSALQSQNEALQALQQAGQSMAEELRQNMMMLPQPGMGAFARGADPFGRGMKGILSEEGVQVPDRMEVRRVREILNELQRRAGDMNRPKPERDYIDRLLQNF